VLPIYFYTRAPAPGARALPGPQVQAPGPIATPNSNTELTHALISASAIMHTRTRKMRAPMPTLARLSFQPPFGVG